jgi:hypothetical protein
MLRVRKRHLMAVIGCEQQSGRAAELRSRHHGRASSDPVRSGPLILKACSRLQTFVSLQWSCTTRGRYSLL